MRIGLVPGFGVARAAAFALLAVTLLVPDPISSAARASPTLPPPDVVSRARGVPSSQVHALAQDARGVLWIAGPAGLASWDGHRVRTEGRPEGLSTQGLRTLSTSSDGRLWIGNDRGVDIRHADGRFEPLVAGGSWPYGWVDQVLEVEPGFTALATSRGLAYWTPGGAVPETAPAVAGRLVTTLARDGSGGFWAGGPALGLWHRSRAGWTAAPGDLVRRLGGVRAIARQPEGTLVVGGERGAEEVDASGRSVRAFEPPPSGEVRALLRDGDRLWLAAATRLLRYGRTPGSWQLLDTVATGVPVNGLLEDAQGNVWVATDNSGVLKYSVMRDVVGRLPLPCGRQVFSISAARDGRSFWIGTEECVFRLEDGSWRTGVPIAGLSGTRTWDLLESPDGSLWAATDRGLLRARAGRVEAFESSNPILAAPARALARRADRLFVGTRRGLAVLGREGAREVLDEAGRSLGYVYTLHFDRSGRLWAGTLGRGLWLIGDSGPVRPAFDGFRDVGNTYAIAESEGGRLAVVQDDRIVILEGARARWIRPATPDAVAGWSASFGSGETLWVGGAAGLVAYDSGSGEAHVRLTRSAGLAGEEFTTSRSLARAGDGHLLCGLDDGLSLVTTEGLSKLPAVPEVQLAEVRWHGTNPVRDSGRLEVAHGRWELRLELAVPWYVDESSLRVRHRLRGIQDEWSGAEGYAVVYSALPAGRYTLEAQAESPLSGRGPLTTLLEFEVLSPWWLRPVPLSGMALLAGLGIAFAWRVRTRALSRRADALEALIRSRTAELVAANSDLVEANRVKDEMLGTVAHDLRSPLTVILAYVGLLEARTLPEPAREEALRSVGRSGRRMLALINDLLDVARIASGRLRLRREDVDLGEYLADVAASHEILGRQKEIVVKVSVPQDLPRVPLDADRIRQVLDNFLSNAIKFSPAGSRVDVEARLAGSQLEIAVADRGLGIEADELARVFDTFEQTSTRPTSGERGWGLGLAIARRLVEMHGGAVFAESRPGEGSRFGFRLPLGLDPAA